MSTSKFLHGFFSLPTYPSTTTTTLLKYFFRLYLQAPPVVWCFDVGCQTEVHPIPSNIVQDYSWNIWEWKRRAIKLVHKNFNFNSTMLYKSVFRRISPSARRNRLKPTSHITGTLTGPKPTFQETSICRRRLTITLQCQHCRTSYLDLEEERMIGSLLLNLRDPLPSEFLANNNFQSKYMNYLWWKIFSNFQKITPQNFQVTFAKYRFHDKLIISISTELYNLL